VGKSDRHKELAHVLSGQFDAEPLLIGGRAAPQVDDHIEDRAVHVGPDTERILQVSPPCFCEEAALVAVHVGLEKERALKPSWCGFHPPS
jgi:hypothetical protein